MTLINKLGLNKGNTHEHVIGDILFVSDSPTLKNVFYNSNTLNYIKWKRGGLSKFKEVDLVFLNDILREIWPVEGSHFPTQKGTCSKSGCSSEKK